VLPGNGVEVVDPNLPEGATVKVIVLTPNAQSHISLYDWMRAATPSDTPRATASWEQYDQFLQ
jgi:hypothetical protein